MDTAVRHVVLNIDYFSVLFISAHSLLENYDVLVGIKIKITKSQNQDGKVVGLEGIIHPQTLHRCHGREYNDQAHIRVFKEFYLKLTVLYKMYYIVIFISCAIIHYQPS